MASLNELMQGVEPGTKRFTYADADNGYWFEPTVYDAKKNRWYGWDSEGDYEWNHGAMPSSPGYDNWEPYVEPVKTVTRYQYAIYCAGSVYVPIDLYKNDDEMKRNYSGTALKWFKRLDHTAVECPE